MMRRNKWLALALVSLWSVSAQAFVRLEPYDSIWSDRLGCENEGKPPTPFCEERRPPTVPGGYPEKKIYCALWDVYVPCGGAGGGAGCTVPGSDTQVMFNDGGACGADAGLTFAKTPDNLALHLGTVGTGGVGVFTIGKGTSPSTAPVDSAQLFSEELAWTDSGATNSGLGVSVLGDDGLGGPLPWRYHLGQQMLIGGTEQNTKAYTGVTINSRDIDSVFATFKRTGSITHGFTSIADTDTVGTMSGNISGLFLNSYTPAAGGQATGMSFSTVVGTEQAQGPNNVLAPFTFTGLTGSGTSAVEMGLAKELFRLRRGATNSANTVLDDTVFSITTSGDVQLRGILHLNSHAEGSFGSSYGGAGTGRGGYIVGNSVGGGSIFFGTSPNDSGGVGNGNASPLGAWTDDIHLLSNGDRVLLIAGALTYDGAAPGTTGNHLYLQGRGPLHRDGLTAGLDSDYTGLGIIGQDGTRLFFGAGGIGADRAPSGAAQDLTVRSESALNGSTNTDAGTLKLSSGEATGSGSGSVEIWTATAGASSNTDRAPTRKWSVNGTGALVGHGSTSGVARIIPPATITDYTLTLPAVGPGAAECLGDSDGDDVLEWVSCAGGGGSGDITDVWGCATGNCNALTAASGDSLDAGSADSTIPAKKGTATPGTCTVGEQFFDTDATAGLNVFGCTATNTWTLLGDGAGGSGDITDVWGCTTGNCSALTAASGDSLNAGSADTTAPMKVGTATPGTCTVGEYFFDSDATAGLNTFACTATNTWTLQGDGTGSSGGAASTQSEGAAVSRSTNQAITTGTFTAIQFTTEDRDDNAYFDSGANTRLTAPATGWYVVSGYSELDSTGTLTQLYVYKNGASYAGFRRTSGNSDNQFLTAGFVLYLSAADYVELFQYHNHGSNRNVSAAKFALARWGQSAMPSAQTIAAADTITADACGGIKQITASGTVTTNTTNTFTAPAAGNSNCVMHVCNVGSNTITLDNNANFKAAGAADVALGADDCVIVGSTGASGKWYQMSPVSVN
jgi:hypothetical protein